MSEVQPSAFALGPLAGTAKELARWILVKSHDVRQLANLADKAVWFQRENRTLFHAYFYKPEIYDRAVSRQRAEQAAARGEVAEK